LVEKRQFDPWGAIVKVQNGAGTNLTKLRSLIEVIPDTNI